MIGPRNSARRGPSAILLGGGSHVSFGKSPLDQVSGKDEQDARQRSESHDPAAPDCRRRRAGLQPRPCEFDQLRDDGSEPLIAVDRLGRCEFPHCQMSNRESTSANSPRTISGQQAGDLETYGAAQRPARSFSVCHSPCAVGRSEQIGPWSDDGGHGDLKVESRVAWDPVKFDECVRPLLYRPSSSKEAFAKAAEGRTTRLLLRVDR